MNNSANTTVYFKSDILTNTSECVIFVCEKPAYFCIPYTVLFMELESRLCQCIEAKTLKIVKKIKYRYPISIFGNFI